MRAFLRPTSSPWIVFDRDSRIDDFARSALRVGAVFASSPSLVSDPTAPNEVVSSVPLEGPMPVPSFAGGAAFGAVAMENGVPAAPATQPMFPPSDPTAESAVVEPSNLVATRDLAPEPARLDEPRVQSELDRAASESDALGLPAGLRSNARRTGWIVGACAGGALLLCAAAVLVSAGRSHVKTASASTQAIAMPVQAVESQPAPAPAPEAAPVIAPTLELDDGTAAAARTAEASPDSAAKTGKHRLLGKLTIKADGKTKNVWFDGKRMLGTGTRSFLVACGMHTVAVNDKADARDIEIPCNGEFVASK